MWQLWLRFIGAPHTLVAGYYSKLSGWPSGIVECSAGWDHICAVKDDGTATCVGALQICRLVVGNVKFCEILMLSVCFSAGNNLSGQCDVPSWLSGVIQVTAGINHTCAFQISGYATCWGMQCDAATHRCFSCSVRRLGSKPVSLASAGDGQYGSIAVPSGLSRVTDLATGAFHSCAVKQDGTVTCWGAVLSHWCMEHCPFGAACNFAMLGEESPDQQCSLCCVYLQG